MLSKRNALIRPENPRFNPFAPLANGLVFAGLAPGGLVGNTLYPDLSAYASMGHGTLVNMDVAAAWSFDSTLGRFVVNFPGDYQDGIIFDRIMVAGRLPCTYTFWLKTANTTSTHWIFQEYRTTAAPPLGLVLNASGGNHKLGLYQSTYYYGDTWTADTNWHCYSMCWNTNDAITFFKDGAAVGSSSRTENGVAATTCQIGRLENGIGDFFINGTLSDFIAHNRILSIAEISELADPSNALLSGLILPPRRKWWPAAAAPAAFKAFWANQATQVAP